MTSPSSSDDYPRALYHYTSKSGLIGILSERVAWATNICFLNDAREFNYASEILKSELDAIQCDETEPFKREIPFLRPLGWGVYPDVYVFSLSETRDHLGMWRAYAGGTAGYSVGFLTSDLLNVAQREGFHLARCIYDREEQERKIRTLLEETRHQINGLTDAHRDFLRFNLHHSFWERFAILAATIKHPSFYEEAEWRLITKGMTIPTPVDRKPIEESKHLVLVPRAVKIRGGPSTVVPYVEISLATADDPRIPLYSIIVGPSMDPPRAVHGIQMLLRTTNQHSPKSVGVSTIPYRTW